MSHKHWTNYWQSGVQTSLPQDFKNNYDGIIFEFWKTVIDRTRKHASVLDVCTGNGAVALIMAKLAAKSEKKLTITAIDISEINTRFIKQNNSKIYTDMIQFKSHCPVESLHTRIQKKQDLIVSQYGLEYSRLEKSAPAIKTVLKNEGELVFIAHSPNSAVFNFMRNEEAIYNWLEQVEIWQTFQRFAKNEINTQQFQRNLLSILKNHRPNPIFKGEPLFIEWLRMISQIRTISLAEISRHKSDIKKFIEQHQFARLRCQDMLEVAEKVKDDAWLEPLHQQGFVLKQKDILIYNNKYLVGDCYHFKIKPKH